MKHFKPLLTGLFIAAFTTVTFGQKNIDITSKRMHLSIEQSKGTNGTAVAFNPDKKLYYAAIAGNTAYPLETFDENGKNVYQTTTQADVRGMWWNVKTQNLQINGYSDFGIITIKTDSRGFAGTGTETILKGLHQPSGNSCGVADKKGKVIYYYDKGAVYTYDSNTGEKLKKVYLSVPTSLDNINYTTVIYTGIKKMEVGILNYEHNEVYLFNVKKGDHTATIKLPGDAVTYSAFRFSYANGFIFLYDVDARNWIGYQVFD